MVVEVLDALAQSDPACRVAAFADLSAGMVLVTNRATAVPGGALPPRERLDALCAEARAALPGADALPGAAPEGGTGALAIAVGAPAAASGAEDAIELRLFLRLAGAPEEALCCLCGPDLDLPAFLDRARDGLTRIAGDGS